MTNTQVHVTTLYRVRDFWRGEANASDARIDEVEITRVVSQYPITKGGAVQWSREERETTVLFRLPVDELGALTKELIETLAYHASGRVLGDLGFEPARAREA
jgi:hypothetical protein